jgi:predicted MFS family arabinose efflux permease
MMDRYGWRGAYVGLGALTLAIAVPAIALLVREPPDMRRRSSAAGTAALPGVSAGEALRSFRMWAIAVAAFLVVTTVNGTIGHFVPILNDRGISPGTAAATLSAVGLSTIAGRIIAGYLLDRLFAPYVAAVVFLLPIVSLTLLGAGVAGNGPLLAAITLGVSLGAEVDLVGFLVSRYFGLRTFGEIYGYLFGIFTFGTGLGQYLMGLSYDFTRSYNVTLVVFGLFLVIASGLMFTLGPYAYPAHRAGTPSRGAAQPAAR